MPFSDIYARLQALGVNPFLPAGTATPPGATPPFLPPSPTAGGGAIGGGGLGGLGPGGPPAKGGLLQRLLAGAFPVSDDGGAVTPEQQRAAQMQGLLGFGTSLLANSGSRPGPRQGLGSLVGQALQAGQGAATGSISDQLQRELLRAKIVDAKRGPAGPQDPALVAEFKFAQANGYKGSFTEYMALKRQEAGDGFGNVNPGQFTPESLAKYQKTKNYADLVPYVAPATPTVAVVNGVPTVVAPSRTGGPTTVNPLSTPEAEAEAARVRAEASAGGSAVGKAEGERAATFQQDLNVIDDEILRTQRLLSDFQNGKYQTGPIAGRFGNVRTAAQNLEREVAKDVIKGISSATFGALSEGERQFIGKLGISQSNNEESNIALLEERLQGLQRTKQRLLTRPPIAVGRQPAATPGSSGRPPLSSFRR